ncbi:MAG: hypothetical protein G01um101416_1044 [Microgenomates group bacterium Gr01-1014_16]|nr:MAG: hypothetical protein G01um101416_1044 [Microgenomates group bacterium Gr01-1014_16]
MSSEFSPKFENDNSLLWGLRCKAAALVHVGRIAWDQFSRGIDLIKSAIRREGRTY